MALYFLYKKYKNRTKDPIQTSELSHPTAPSKNTAPSHPTAPSKNHECVHRRGVSQISEAAVELIAYPGDRPYIHDETTTTQRSFPCPECRDAKRAARKYRWRIVSGLFVPFLIQSLDSTIIAGALPFIASDFSKSASPILNSTKSHNPQTNSRS